MTVDQLKIEIAHIMESGVNEIRLLDLLKRYGRYNWNEACDAMEEGAIISYGGCNYEGEKEPFIKFDRPYFPEDKCWVCGGTGVFEDHPELEGNPKESCLVCSGRGFKWYNANKQL